VAPEASPAVLVDSRSSGILGDMPEITLAMRTRRVRASLARSAFAGFCFPPEVIVLSVRWYLRFALSYRDVEELLAVQAPSRPGQHLSHRSPLLADTDRTETPPTAQAITTSGS
jgi:hypothetical protein